MKFNDKGISQKFKLVYSLQSNMKKKPITVLARFRRVGEIVAVDYKFKDLEKWFKAFEANEQLGHYLSSIKIENYQLKLYLIITL